MPDDDEFDYIVKNSQRVLGLSFQHENHQYVEEFTKQSNVMYVYGIYVLEGEADAKFSLSELWKLFQEDPLPNNTSNFYTQMMNCMKAWNYLQKTSDLPLNTEIIKQTHKIMIYGEDILMGEYRKSLVFAGYHIFAPASLIERYTEDAIFRFPVILSSFHSRGRRHYIRVVKMFHGKPSMLYTMILKFLIHCWDNSEQNARMLDRRWRLISNTPIIDRRPPTDQG